MLQGPQPQVPARERGPAGVERRADLGGRVPQRGGGGVRRVEGLLGDPVPDRVEKAQGPFASGFQAGRRDCLCRFERLRRERGGGGEGAAAAAAAAAFGGGGGGQQGADVDDWEGRGRGGGR